MSGLCVLTEGVHAYSCTVWVGGGGGGLHLGTVLVWVGGKGGLMQTYGCLQLDTHPLVCADQPHTEGLC